MYCTVSHQQRTCNKRSNRQGCRMWGGILVFCKKNAKRLLRHSRSFKVIEDGINRKPVCDFLLVINSNWHPISYRFGVIASYCSNFGHFAFLSSLPVSVNWIFFARCYGWVPTSEKRSKIGDFAPTRSVWSKISDRRDCPPPIIFARIVRPMNALQLCRWQFSH